MNYLCNFEKKKNGNCKFIFKKYFFSFLWSKLLFSKLAYFYSKYGFDVGEVPLNGRILR